jgi:hypothetical protein
MIVARHASHSMLLRCSYVRMGAKRRDLDDSRARQRDTGREGFEGRKFSQPAVVQ